MWKDWNESPQIWKHICISYIYIYVVYTYVSTYFICVSEGCESFYQIMVLSFMAKSGIATTLKYKQIHYTINVCTCFKHKWHMQNEELKKGRERRKIIWTASRCKHVKISNSSFFSFKLHFIYSYWPDRPCLASGHLHRQLAWNWISLKLIAIFISSKLWCGRWKFQTVIDEQSIWN